MGAKAVAIRPTLQTKPSDMRHFLLTTATVCCLSVTAAGAAERYGEWVLEQARSFVLTLSFKQSATLNNRNATSELAFACDQRDKSKIIGVVLIPFDGMFKNHQDRVPVAIQKGADEYDPFDIMQKWKNGTEYIFLESQNDVDELAAFLKANETTGAKSVHFFFPNDPDITDPEVSNHIVISVSGFSDGFTAFQTGCSR